MSLLIALNDLDRTMNGASTLVLTDAGTLEEIFQLSGASTLTIIDTGTLEEIFDIAGASSFSPTDAGTLEEIFRLAGGSVVEIDDSGVLVNTPSGPLYVIFGRSSFSPESLFGRLVQSQEGGEMGYGEVKGTDCPYGHRGTVFHINNEPRCIRCGVRIVRFPGVEVP